MSKQGNILLFNPSGEFYFTKGIEAFQRNNFSQAKKYLTRAWYFEPNEPVIACQLAIVLAEIGEYNRSNEILYQVLQEIDQYMYECHYFLANNFAYLGMYKEASEHAKHYLKYMPNGEYVNDTKDLLEVISLEADDIKTTCLSNDIQEEDEIITRQEQSRKLLEEGKFSEAITLLKEMIKDYPTFWPAYNNMALANYYEGNVEKAINYLDQVLEENPGNLHALCNLTAFRFYQGKDINENVAALKKIHPISSDHRFKLGVTFIILGQYDEGYSWLKKILHQGSLTDTSFYYWFAYGAYYIGKTELANKAWKKYLHMHPEKEGTEPWKQEN